MGCETEKKIVCTWMTLQLNFVSVFYEHLYYRHDHATFTLKLINFFLLGVHNRLCLSWALKFVFVQQTRNTFYLTQLFARKYYMVYLTYSLS